MSSVPFVLSISYKKNEIYKPFFRTRNFTWTCTELWSVIIFVENILGCSRRYCRSASYLPSAAAEHADQNISKESIHGECLLILLDNRSNITLWYGTNFFIIWHHYREDGEIHATWHNYQHHYPASRTCIGSNNFGEYTSFSPFTLGELGSYCIVWESMLVIYLDLQMHTLIVERYLCSMCGCTFRSSVSLCTSLL